MNKKIVIIDDHALIAKGIQSCLDEVSQKVESQVIPSFSEAESFIRTSAHEVYIFLLDGNLESGRKGYQLIPLIKQYYPKAKIISTSSGPVFNQKAIDEGADGVWSKRGEPEDLISLIESLL